MGFKVTGFRARFALFSVSARRQAARQELDASGWLPNMWDRMPQLKLILRGSGLVQLTLISEM